MSAGIRDAMLLPFALMAWTAGVLAELAVVYGIAYGAAQVLSSAALWLLNSN